MPIFHYKARDVNGVTIAGGCDVNDQYVLAHVLRAEWFTVLFVVEAGARTRFE